MAKVFVFKIVSFYFKPWVGKLALILILAIAGISCMGERAMLPSTERPNIILIYGDDIGYGDIGAYGATKINTPHLDTLARQGVRFTDAYASSSTCTPSRYSLLTGRYAFRKEGASILSGDAPLVVDVDRPTVASILSDAGYTTGIVGKWHMGLGNGSVNWNERIAPGPMELGFDRSFIMPSTNDRVPTVYMEGHRVYNLSENDPPLRVSYDEQIGNLPTGESHPEQLRYPADPQHSGTIIDSISRIGWMSGGQSAWWEEAQIAPTFTQRAQDFIKDMQDQPFFLYLPLRDVHVPRWPAEPFRGRSETGLRGDAIEEADWVVGQIMATLRALELDRETLVIFTSDNGPVYDDGYEDGAIPNAHGHVANGPLRGGKYQSFEGGTRVPFLVHWPDRAEAGTTSDAIISQVDLLATLAAIAEAPLPDGAAPDSEALPAALLGRSTQGRAHVVQQGTGKLALRRGKWKYIPEGDYPEFAFSKHNSPESPIANPMPPNDQALLFNLDEDLDESNNVIDTHPEIAEEMAELLDSLRTWPAPKGNSSKVDS